MKHTLTPLAQHLRKNQTKEEARLWYQFLRRYPLQFRRQFQIGPYIVDFYCAKALLVIELDGSQHYKVSEKEHDRRRTEYLESLGITVLRYSNSDVNLLFRRVCEDIDLAVKTKCKLQD